MVELGMVIFTAVLYIACAVCALLAAAALVLGLMTIVALSVFFCWTVFSTLSYFTRGTLPIARAGLNKMKRTPRTLWFLGGAIAAFSVVIGFFWRS